MEYCDINLEEYVLCKRRNIHGLMDWDKAISAGHGPFMVCAIMQQIMAGVSFIHGQNEVHRDLNPQNRTLQIRAMIDNSIIFIDESMVEDCGFRIDFKGNIDSKDHTCWTGEAGLSSSRTTSRGRSKVL